MPKVTLYLRFETSHGERSFARPVASNGKPLTDTGIPKPLYAFVNGRAEHHPEGQYFLRYTQNGKRMWESVGSDCWVALDKKAGRERSLRDQERGAAPAGAILSSLTHLSIVDAVEQYTARVKAMKAKRTVLRSNPLSRATFRIPMAVVFGAVIHSTPGFFPMRSERLLPTPTAHFEQFPNGLVLTR